MPKTIEELDGELCKYCPCTDYGFEKINTGPWNLCEGCACDKAYEKYLEDNQDEEE
ncbi:hypothetical protein ACWG0P_07195 [Amedibacillus sp. YH-ame6]